MRVPGRQDDAVAQLVEALRLRPGDGEAHYDLGMALGPLGRAAEAVAQLEEALRLMPGYPEIRVNIAAALLRSPGHESEASAQLEAYLRERPADEAARRMLARIRAGQP
jgi:Flp pilus assembly protein TadD